MVNKFLTKWTEIATFVSSKGIPVPMIRDPKSGIGSVSLTLVFLSATMVMVGLIGKWSKMLGDIDINNSLQFFYASSALYFGRNLSTKNGNMVAEQEKPPTV